MDTRDRAKGIARYYENRVKESDYIGWAEGLQVSTKLVALIDNTQSTLEEAEQLFVYAKSVDKELRNPMWGDLLITIEDWIFELRRKSDVSKD